MVNSSTSSGGYRRKCLTCGHPIRDGEEMLDPGSGLFLHADWEDCQQAMARPRGEYPYHRTRPHQWTLARIEEVPDKPWF
jgi:hypothetical protein